MHPDSPQLHGTPFLMVVEGASRGAHASLDAGEVIIGRDEGCGLRIADAHCSRRHARVISTPLGARVEDLGSRNGTHLNDVRLTSGTPLTPRDQLRIGDTVIALQMGSGSHATAPPGPVQPEAFTTPGSLSEIPGRRAPESVLRELAPPELARRRAYMITVGLIVLVAVGVITTILFR